MTNKTDVDLSGIPLDDLTDVAILAHGFTPYKRDYFFHIETLWKEPFAGQYIVLFRHCYEFTYSTVASGEILSQSWDELYIDFDEYLKAGEPEGYVWGTNHMNAYPGFMLIEKSKKANDWSIKLGKQMQEVEIEAEIFRMNLIFSDWILKRVNNQTNLISQILFPLNK